MAAGVLGQIINSFGQVAVLPLFLHFWTKRAYGEWLVLTAVPNLLWSLEGGLGLLALNQMVLRTSVNDWKSANRIFQNIFVLQMIISVALVLGGYVVATCFNFLPLLNITEISRGDATFILVTMLVYMAFGWGIALLRAPYFAAERSTRGTMLTNLWKLSDFLVIGIVLLLHGSGRFLAVGETIVVAIWVLLGCLDLRRICPDFRFGVRDVSWTDCKAACRDGVPLFLLQAGSALFIQGFPLIISRTLGTLAVVNFTAIRTVTRILLQGITTLTQAASVELTSSLAREKWDLYLRWVKILTFCVMGASICACSALYFAGPWAIGIWTHGKVVVGGGLLLLFGISVALQAGWTLFGTLVYTANKHHLQCYIYFGVTLAALVVGRFTIGHFGFGFVPVLMIATDFILLITTIVICTRNLREVRFANLLILFHPLFYWNKLRWVITKTRGEGLYFWSPNR